MTVRAGLKVTIGTKQFVADLNRISRRPLPAVRQQIDQGETPGEGSLANDAVWPRVGRDFQLGAGQEFYDEPDESSRLRFWTSKGIDPWDPRSLALHQDTTQERTSANTNLLLVANTNGLWFADGQVLRWLSGGSWTTASGLPASDIQAMTAFYGNVYVGYSNGDIYEVDFTGAGSLFNSDLGAITALGYANGRFLAANVNQLYEINGDGTSTLIWTVPYGGFRWRSIVSAPNAIYVAGDDTSKGEIYAITVSDATGALDPPFYAMGLPDDEWVLTMAFYGGVMILGTVKGIRLAAIDANGFLVHGPLIDDPGFVQALEPQGEFCWFSWTNYDGTSTGLGRLRLDRFTGTLTPAFASDLMATAQGSVTSIATYENERWFAVSGVGVYSESANKVASGSYNSGWVTYGIPERKSIAGAEVRHEAMPAGASVVMQIEEDDGTVNSAITSSSGLGSAAELSGIETETVRVLLTLNRATAATTGPTVRRWTLRSIPMPYRSEELIIPIFLRDTVSEFDKDVKLDTLVEWQYLKGLEAARARVPLVIGGETLTVMVEVSLPEGETIGWNDKRNWLETTAIVRAVTAEVA